MRLVHVGLDFKHKAGESVLHGIHHPGGGAAGQGRRGHGQKVLQKGLHTEVCKGRAEEHRRELPVAHPLHVKLAGGPLQQLNIVGKLLMKFFSDQPVQAGVAGLHLGGRCRPGAAMAGEVNNLAPLPVVNALKLLAAADGPVHRIGFNAQLMFNLLAELEGIPCLPVHFVDKGKDGNVPQHAHFKELAGLSLHALGSVDDHDGGVGRHEGAIGVLGEVLVAGGVQNINAVALVLELHHRGGNRNAPLLFYFHPVGDSRPAVLFSLDRARLSDGTAVKKKFFRQRGFARVRMRDDGKGPAAAYFRFKLRQGEASQQSKFPESMHILPESRPRGKGSLRGRPFGALYGLSGATENSARAHWISSCRGSVTTTSTSNSPAL
ncbi:hypothetical protein SDC9_91523 [bioreactor metagenome]|uniref:Uncharacterized protein n=1 Tax=bioreactor metagenome TaxID=1076179 RepID=A0A644ZY28_9ZZZZ